MDNQNLDRLLQNSGDRSFWLKPWELPANPVDRTQVFTGSPICVAFSKNRRPRVAIGDILVVYRTRARNIVYVAECLETAVEASPQDILEEEWREQFPWSFPAKNLTPELGSNWNRLRLQPFQLAKEFSKLHPGIKFTLYGVMHGSSVVPMPREFGEFLIQRIQELT